MRVHGRLLVVIMGEPSLPPNRTIRALQDEELRSLLEHKFPGAVVDNVDGKFVALTIHGVGTTLDEAIKNSLIEYSDMERDGSALEQMLNDIREDLKTPGMGRERHDSLMDLLDTCESALNAGALTKTVPWIMIPSLNREITDLKRRVGARLGMMAQTMKDRDRAKNNAAQTFKRKPDDGLTPYQRLMQNRRAN